MQTIQREVFDTLNQRVVAEFKLVDFLFVGMLIMMLSTFSFATDLKPIDQSMLSYDSINSKIATIHIRIDRNYGQASRITRLLI